jgi:two-component system phosphate regulon sensor histidine kinase PhoR
MAAKLPDGLIVLDEHGCITWANEPAAQWLSLNLKQDKGLPIQNLVRQPNFVSWLKTTDEDEKAAVLEIAAPGDEDCTIAMSQVGFDNNARMIFARDITHYEQSAQLRREFIASASHELKTPLTVIVGFIEIAKDMASDEKQARYLTLMQQQAIAMQRLVEDLLTLSALESGQQHHDEIWFDVQPFFAELCDNANALSQNKHIIEFEIERPAEIYGVRHELASAVANLLSNAVHYTPDGGKITLSFSPDKTNHACIAVRDTGIGIAPQHLPRLTERFYRVDRSRSRASGGTGLGLAIVKHVLKQHQSGLNIDSVVGEGSVFSFVLGEDRVRFL